MLGTLLVCLGISAFISTIELFIAKQHGHHHNNRLVQVCTDDLLCYDYPMSGSVMQDGTGVTCQMCSVVIGRRLLMSPSLVRTYSLLFGLILFYLIVFGVIVVLSNDSSFLNVE